MPAGSSFAAMEIALLRHHAPGPDRFRLALLKLTGRLPRKGQRLDFVQIGTARLKRIVLRDSYLAAEMERVFEAFGPSAHLPRLVLRHENEVWAQFVPGTPLARSGDAMRTSLAAFFTAVYARHSRLAELADTPFPARLERDLGFLHSAGVLDAPTWRALSAAADRLAPARVWVGFDYTDAVHKNFIVRDDDGAVCGVDIESLRDGQLIGVGVVKAALRWLADAPGFLDLLARPGVPDVRAYYRYVELSFIARWTKTKVMTAKSRFVDRGHFERFLTPP